MNELSITGNAVSDPRIWVSPRGDTRATFRFAYNHRYFSKSSNEWIDGGTSYLDVSCWRQLAEHVIETVSKGMPLIVVGAVRVKQIPASNDPTTTRNFIEVEATAIGPDLAKGIATFARTKKPQVEEQEHRALAEVTALPQASGF